MKYYIGASGGEVVCQPAAPTKTKFKKTQIL